MVISVPNILVFDQPIQVYFPLKGISEGSSAEEDMITDQIDYIQSSLKHKKIPRNIV